MRMTDWVNCLVVWAPGGAEQDEAPPRCSAKLFCGLVHEVDWSVRTSHLQHSNQPDSNPRKNRCREVPRSTLLGARPVAAQHALWAARNIE